MSFRLTPEPRRNHQIGRHLTALKTPVSYLQEVRTLRLAIKQGDVAMLRRLVDPLIVVLYGAEQY